MLLCRGFYLISAAKKPVKIKATRQRYILYLITSTLTEELSNVRQQQLVVPRC